MLCAKEVEVDHHLKDAGAILKIGGRKALQQPVFARLITCEWCAYAIPSIHALPEDGCIVSLKPRLKRK
jgi:hypothetical protein